MDIREQMDKIYREMAPEEIPWNLSDPPAPLVDIVESGQIKPCAAVDLGCGAGNYAVWLAQKGFDVTGIDISRQAIRMARDLAAAKGVSCRFVTADLLGDLTEYEAGFDFAYDWELLHHIFPKDRSVFIKNVHRLLRPGGSYLSLCFSEKDISFGGVGKYRRTPLGTELYFSSEDELRELFEPLFEVVSLKTIEIAGRRGAHMANSAWLKRR